MRIIKLCGNSIWKLLSMILNGCVREAKFPSDYKKSTCCTCSQEKRSAVSKIYRPISLLPIFGKIFKSLIYNELFTFSTHNKLTSPNQSGFRPGDSCVNQLLMKYINRLMTDLK